jgi:hypothetical protein
VWEADQLVPAVLTDLTTHPKECLLFASVVKLRDFNGLPQLTANAPHFITTTPLPLSSPSSSSSFSSSSSPVLPPGAAPPAASAAPLPRAIAVSVAEISELKHGTMFTCPGLKIVNVHAQQTVKGDNYLAVILQVLINLTILTSNTLYNLRN